MPNVRGLHNGNWLGVIKDFRPIPGLEGGGGIRVIAYWPGFWSARRAQQLQTRYAEVIDGGAAAPEESTYQPFLVRLPFRGFGRNPYRFSQTFGESFTPPEADTTPIWLARPKFLPLGRSQFRFQQPQDLDTPIDFEHPGFIARPQFKSLGFNRFIFGKALDDSFTPAVEDWSATFVARAKLGQWFYNRYTLTQGTDSEIIAASFEFVPSIFIRFMRSGYDARRAAFLLHTFSTQDESAPAPVIPGEVMVVIPETPGAVKVRVMIEHPTTTRVVVESPNKVFVVPQDDPTAIPLKVVI